MNWWEFADKHTVVAVIMALAFLVVLDGLFSRIFRHMNIRSQGWPPAHCDVDGDAVENGEEEGAK